MKDINLLVWLMQLGISVAVPLAGFILLSVWLHNSRGWGSWVVIAGVILGILAAVSGLRSSLAYLNKASKPKGEDEQNVIMNVINDTKADKAQIVLKNNLINVVFPAPFKPTIASFSPL